jgi:hypothetical protein
VLVDGLLEPKGLTIGPDGNIYVAESGTGGTTTVELEGSEFLAGYTGRISMVDPETGERTTVVDELPSSAFPPEEAGAVPEAVGPTDVAFIGDQLYYLQTHGGEEWGFPDFETGIYSVDNDGDLDLIADIGAFNKANPVDAITSGTQVDVEPGGNPYSMQVRNGVFYVIDGNHNRMLRVTTGGAVSEVVEFPNHPVSTGIDFATDGTAYVSYLGQGPFPPEQGKVVTVNINSGAIVDADVASGASMLTAVEFGPGNQLYALQFNDTTAGEFPAFGPFSGSIRRVNADGTMTPVVVGLSFATFLIFDGDTAYVSNWGVTDDGQILEIENFSSVQPPAPTPTTAAPTATAAAPVATPTRSGIVAPDTGDGGASSGGGLALPLALMALLGGGLAVAGLRLATRRAR